MKKFGRDQWKLGEMGSAGCLAVLGSCSEARRDEWHIRNFFFRNMGKAAHLYLGGMGDL